MTERFSDRFNREDSFSIGDGYTIPCGDVAIFDESVLPRAESMTGESPFGPGIDQKVQVLYTGDTLDQENQIVRGVWGHDDVTPTGVDQPPSFTLLARMTKDPLIINLGGDEEPFCYDQGYGLRVTCPLDGSAPVLKIIKYLTARRAPGLNRPSSTEVDGAQVLASITLQSTNLNVDPDWDGTGNFPYKGRWQDMRLRIRLGDDKAVLDAYLNDVNLNTPVLSYTDQEDPVWSEVGRPGFEFISARLTDQPDGASPFEESAFALMRCTLFSVNTITVVRRPVKVTPSNHWTYDRIISRVITHVEKNGDAKFTASLAGNAKLQTYLDFIIESELAICRKEGYWHWLARRSRLYLSDGIDTYEMPEDLAELQSIQPGSWNAEPLVGLDEVRFKQKAGGIVPQGGFPRAYYFSEETVNARRSVTMFPNPSIEEGTQAYVDIVYYGRPVPPAFEDISSTYPTIPQHHMDVLIYTAAAHALLLDTDPQNTQFYVAAARSKLAELVRENNRLLGTKQLLMQSAADIGAQFLQRPLTRATSLEGFGFLL